MISTVRGADRLAAVPPAGNLAVIDLEREMLGDGVARLTGGAGADVVLDVLGGALTGPALGRLRHGGVLVSIGYIEPATDRVYPLEQGRRGPAARRRGPSARQGVPRPLDLSATPRVRANLFGACGEKGCPDGTRSEPAVNAPARISADSDREVIGRSAREPEAFALLYDRHAPRLHRYVPRRLGDGHADDLVAETFLIAFQRRGAFDGSRAEALPWLYGIAGNLIARHRRTEVRVYRAMARMGGDPSVRSHADQVDVRVTATAALARLSAKDREALLLVTWADLSYEQAAEALDAPVGTVRSRLNRARRKLRAALGDRNPLTTAAEGESR
ncbi:sigma-70 family RNA polymerase sigma factor [Actinomadura decatromicini]|uniref:Sigma-70 family RNA polymerase sigma factor n=1 Tax=Actinomadura decatromicini TaxID=2604572 RepID=A0A5D3FA67_9ACTN|nr:sigma-70 family RNA polymerase sigma factor [Actinomadura decatromicini]